MTTDAKRHILKAPSLVAPVEGKASEAEAAPDRKSEPQREHGRISCLEGELASVRDVLDVTLNNVEQGILMIDAEHYVRLYNKKFVDLLEIPEEI
jgi:hypothetical protein